MKTYSWPELLKIVYNEDRPLEYVIYDFSPKYRKLVALALSVVHWHPSQHKKLNKKDPEYMSWVYCGLCCFCDSECSFCPLNKTPCSDRDSPWHKAMKQVVSGKKTNDMYKVLVKLYKEEYEQLAAVG